MTRIIRKYSELYTNEEEMDKFLERQKWSKLTQEQIENWNGPVTRKEIQLVILNFPTEKSSVPDGFNGEFHQIFREKLFQKKRGGNTSQLILWGHYHPDAKARQNVTRKLHTNLSHEPLKTLSKILAAYKKDYKPRPIGIHPRNAGWMNIWKPINQ